MTEAKLLRRPRGRPSRHGKDFSDTRALLIRCGTEMLTEQGVNATALDAVLKRVGVPKGSFYHYFASKEAFVAAVVDNYAAYFAKKLDRHFGNPALPPLERLSTFIADACAGMQRHDFRRGCLVGNLGQEVSGLDEPLRQRLEAVFLDWERRLAACLADAFAASRATLPATLPAAASAEAPPDTATTDNVCAALAHAFWIGWEGAVLRGRLQRSTAPMTAFASLFFAALPPALKGAHEAPQP